MYASIDKYYIAFYILNTHYYTKLKFASLYSLLMMKNFNIPK